jgi:hypothetical protein
MSDRRRARLLTTIGIGTMIGAVLIAGLPGRHLAAALAWYATATFSLYRAETLTRSAR